ncbi:hypothetical protein H8B13_11745 [Hymenobacter sp. BT188]|uniref:hypothetical protein n=1 Tax=Hymenobacter sp. BT188 TaxID=2763504 RepID=UPI001650E586|nr:hypothetical protein [Hymenobacter sp. BT188]MBC6607492.1 hypothetical protein [Hymenobacter sp. BT188]
MTLHNNKLKSLGPKLRRAQKQEISRLNHKRKEKKKLVAEIIISILIISGLLLSVCEVILYRKTLISSNLLISIAFVIALTVTIFTRGIFRIYLDTNNFFLQLLYNLTSWGGIIVYLFMSLNYYFPSDSPSIVRASILKSGKLAQGRYGCRDPYVEVYVKGVNKEIFFPCGFDTEGYSYARVTLRKGLFGFDTIMDQSLGK